MPRAFVRSYAYQAVDPAGQLLLGPAYAIPRALDRAGIALSDVDLVEMHEAFAAQVLSTFQKLESRRLCPDRARAVPARRYDRPGRRQPARWVDRARPPVRRHRRALRDYPGERASRGRRRPGPGLGMRGRRRRLRHRARSGVTSAPGAPTAAGARFELPSPPDADVGRIVIDRADDRVNALDQHLVEGLSAAIRAARACRSLRGLLVVSAKPDQWIAGADLKGLSRATTVGQLEAISRRFQAVCDELAWLPCTTVAALNGPALGGGWEVALACDYRVAADRPNVLVGQPEVSLGLVPAGGATQRLPRLVGLAVALDLILNGRRLKVHRAARLGLLDEVVHPAVLDTAARAWASRSKRSLDRRLEARLTLGSALDAAEQTPAGRRLIYRARPGGRARTHRCALSSAAGRAVGGRDRLRTRHCRWPGGRSAGVRRARAEPGRRAT